MAWPDILLLDSLETIWMLYCWFVGNDQSNRALLGFTINLLHYIVIYWGGRAIHNLTHSSHNKHEILWHNTGQMSLSMTFYEHMSSYSHLNCVKCRPIRSLLRLRITLRFWQTFSDIQYRKWIAAYKHWSLLRFRALSRKSVPLKFIWLWMES